LDVDAIRTYNVVRMEKMMEQAIGQNADLVVFPELALTSFFPYFWITDFKILKKFFESSEKWKNKIYQKAKELKISVAFGYAEQVGEDKCNLFSLFVPNSKSGNIYTYQKVHIPGFDKPRLNEKTFQFEKKYFKPGKGYPVWSVQIKKSLKARIGLTVCHDRRYSNPYLVMGLRKVEIVLNGFNTPFYLTFNNKLDGDVYKFHYFPLQAQALTEGTYIVSVARAGDIFGHEQIAGTCIVSPDGELLAKTEKLDEDIIYADIDLDLCMIVKDIKYHGERSQPEVLYKELRRHLNE
jgi:predicted amidohydrolase